MKIQWGHHDWVGRDLIEHCPITIDVQDGNLIIAGKDHYLLTKLPVETVERVQIYVEHPDEKYPTHAELVARVQRLESMHLTNHPLADE